jgi:Asp/Glu/hydantoin racemase
VTVGLRGNKFTIIAISTRIAAWYKECARFYHAERRLAHIHPLSSSLRDIGSVQTDHTKQLLELCRLAVEEDGADSIILAGAPLAGLGRQISDRVPVPLIDGVAAGIVQAEALARLGHAAPRAGSMRPPGRKKHKGLSAGLAKFFETERGA